MKQSMRLKLLSKVGYRLFDTATAYGNETAVGMAINNSGINHNEFFVTSKLWVDHFTYEKAKQGIDDSLNKLGMDYLDLYLLHQPYGDITGAWQALEKVQKVGKIRSIGVSNFYPDQLKVLELMSDVKPAVNQIEVSPWYQRDYDIQFNRRENIVTKAWAPLAEGNHQIFTNPVIMQIAKKMKVSFSISVIP